MDGLYLYCMACGWKNDHPEDRKSDLDDVSTEELITELSSRIHHYEPEEFEDVLDQLRRDYVGD